MNTKFFHMSTFAAALLGTASLLGCSDGGGSFGQAGGYDEFREAVYQEPGTGVFIVDGDTPIVGESALHDFFAHLPKAGVATVQQDLAVALTPDGSYTAWSDVQRGTLTYCISTAFGASHDTVQRAIATAASDWMTASGASVTLIHDATQDSSCTGANNNVIFDVNPTSGQPYAARSFFPNSARADRNILIDSSAFSLSGPVTLTGVLRHELGHVLGFRHEHTRPEAGACFEDNNWYALTPYDSASVMHYPQCNGTNTGDLVITAMDKAGLVKLYPRFVGGPTEIVPGVQFRLTNSFLGSLNSLDTRADGNQDPFMNATGSVRGQSWYASDAGAGWYRISNDALGNTRMLDTYGDTHAPFMGVSGNFSGQFWHLSFYGNHCIRLTNMFLGDSFSLDTYSDTRTPFMGTTGDYSGQCWHFTRI